MKRAGEETSAEDAQQTKKAHKDQVREHYNKHVQPVLNTKQALAQRAQSQTYPLKRFHNDVKRQLLLRFSRGKSTLLDMCCGRGGDILKWNETGLQYVRGVDISEQEVAEASRRFAEFEAKQRGRSSLQADFQVESNLGEQPFDGDGPYDIVTCMFALHYFFESESRLRMFLRNVSRNLAPGGYFIGTIPDAKRVLFHMGERGRMISPMLKLKKDWQGSGPLPTPDNPYPSPFGHRYYYALTDTVTSGVEGSEEGSMEFLAFWHPIFRMASHYGMVAVENYESPELDRLFEPESAPLMYKYFQPQFPGYDGSLEVASSVNVAFVFRKVAPGEEVPPLNPPLPSQLPHVYQGGAQSDVQHPQHGREQQEAQPGAGGAQAGWAQEGEDAGQEFIPDQYQDNQNQALDDGVEFQGEGGEGEQQYWAADAGQEDEGEGAGGQEMSDDYRD